MEKLRECPFCGGEAVKIEAELYEWFIICTNCDAEISDDMDYGKDGYNPEKNVTEKWNTRFTPGYETPEQYKARTGKDWPDDAPVYALHNSDAGYWWQLYEFSNVHDSNWLLVCATEAGKPSADWRPGVD